jgi:hypothetical protein
MKKIIGILGVAVIAAAMFFSANNVSGSSSDIGLASLMNMNVAHADSEGGTTCTVTTNCYNWGGTNVGTVSCTGAKCSRDTTSVTCDGKKTSC